MSRIGKQVIPIPPGIKVTQDGAALKVTGPQGTLTKTFRDDITINIAQGVVTLNTKRSDKFSRSLWGTYAAHIKNMVQGVKTLCQRRLTLEGIGYKSEVRPARTGTGAELVFALGLSHPVIVSVPEGVSVTVEKNNITIIGIDKELVGNFAAGLRALKKPEPYKGKGMRYEGEVIRRKQGKKTV